MASSPTQRRYRWFGFAGIIFALACFTAILALFPRPAADSQAGPEAIAWREPVTVASGDGHRGPWRMNRSQYDFVDDPSVALTPAGEAAVVWVDQAAKTIRFQRYGPGGTTQLDAPSEVSASPDIFSWLPRIRVAPDRGEEIYVLWQEIVFSGANHGGEILFARSTDGGTSFAAPINLSSSAPGDGKGRLTEERWDNGSLDLAIGPTGRLYAAWTAYRGRLHVARSTDRGASFSQPVHVAGSRQTPARWPALAVDAGGRVHLAWAVGARESADIRFASSQSKARSFSAPRTIAESAGHSDAPDLAATGAGRLHLVFGESPEGRFGRYHIRYTRSDDGGASFGPARAIAEPGDAGLASLHYPTLAARAERLAVLMERFPRARRRPVGLSLAVSQNGGSAFRMAGPVPATADPKRGVNGSQQGLLMDKLALGRNGALAVVETRFRRGESSRIRLHRGHWPAKADRLHR